jgi:murein DD-endopeptidase MepM/ murein hydrolase activator NlpD
MWRIQNNETGQIREWGAGVLREADRGEDGFLDPERLLNTGLWTDVADNWSHTRGTIIMINHAQDISTIYYHTNPDITVGATVSKGDNLGETANTGWSTGSHLHYTLRINGEVVNPSAPPKIIEYMMP